MCFLEAGSMKSPRGKGILPQFHTIGVRKHVWSHPSLCSWLYVDRGLALVLMVKEGLAALKDSVHWGLGQDCGT